MQAGNAAGARARHGLRLPQPHLAEFVPVHGEEHRTPQPCVAAPPPARAGRRGQRALAGAAAAVRGEAQLLSLIHISEPTRPY